MTEPEDGIVSHTVDSGASTHVVVRASDGGVRSFDVDSAWLRRMLQYVRKPSLATLRIEFLPDGECGIVWLSVIPEGYARCASCAQFIAPHLDASRCFNGFHIRKHLPLN